MTSAQQLDRFSPQSVPLKLVPPPLQAGRPSTLPPSVLTIWLSRSTAKRQCVAALDAPAAINHLAREKLAAGIRESQPVSAYPRRFNGLERRVMRGVLSRGEPRQPPPR